jgi:hypothetical protein
VAITDGKSPLTAKPLGAPPHIKQAEAKQGELQPLAVALTTGGARPGLEWEPVDRASGYQIEISADPSFRAVADMGHVEGSQTRYTTKALPPGSYFARVIAFDEVGLASKPSDPSPLRVTTVELPAGGVVDAERSAVVAPPGTRLRLPDSGELELAKEGEHFAPAPAELTVDPEPRMLRLRRKADYGHETRVFVEPRGLRADVRLTPFWARWPDDGVDLSVTLRDPTGRVDPTNVEPELQVLVGIEPVTVDWKRDGALLTAHLDPRAATGPAVVRVIAKDHDGALLGRNFLEIEPVFVPRLGHQVPLANR